METAPSPPGHAIAGKGRNCRADEPSAFTPRDQALRARIVAHCRAMYALDRTYANWAFDNYARMLPWLGLERK